MVSSSGHLALVNAVNVAEKVWTNEMTVSQFRKSNNSRVIVFSCGTSAAVSSCILEDLGIIIKAMDIRST